MVLMALITLADEEDNVLLDVARLARVTNLPRRVVEKGVGVLMEPDPASKNPEHEGRRIVYVNPEAPGIGWHIVSREYYKRMFTSAHRREYQRGWMRKYRGKIEATE